MSNRDRMSDSEASQIEDYGTADDTGSGDIADDMSSGGNSNMVGAAGSGNADISGGSEGSEGGQGSGRGEMFGEFGDTGTGTDLTIQMESNEIDPRSGLVKGGAAGEDEIAGLGQYGGETGGVTGQDG